MRTILITFIVLFASIGCTNFVYQPSRAVYFSPSERLNLEPSDIYFSSPEGPKLHGWYFKTNRNNRKGVVVQFHGNAENLTSHFMSMIWVLNYGYDLFTFDYRGYGKSEGAPYPAGVKNDVLAALFKARDLAGDKPRSLILYGQSLGGAALINAVPSFPHPEVIRTIVLEGTFLSYKSISRQKLSEVWLTWPLQWMAYLLVSDEYSPKRSIERVSLPLLVTHGEDDPIVPLKYGKRVFDSASEPKCFWPISGRRHVGLMNLDQGAHRATMLAYFDTGACPQENRGSSETP